MVKILNITQKLKQKQTNKTPCISFSHATSSHQLCTLFSSEASLLEAIYCNQVPSSIPIL